MVKKVDHSDDTFVRITNKDIYNVIKNSNKNMSEEINGLNTQVVKLNLNIKTMNGNVRLHRKWLYGLSSSFCAGFLFIVGFLLKGGRP